MSEVQPRTPEAKGSNPEAHRPKIEFEVSPEKHREALEKQAEQAQTASQEALKEATTTAEYASRASEQHSQSQQKDTLVNPELHKMARGRVLTSVRKKLPVLDRTFSKITHQPVVDKVSDVSSEYIARPYPILFGGITALIGCSILLYFARRDGFNVPPILFAALFTGGFVIGLAIEMFVRMFRRNRG
jgi:hypothetical protein